MADHAIDQAALYNISEGAASAILAEGGTVIVERGLHDEPEFKVAFPGGTTVGTPQAPSYLVLPSGQVLAGECGGARCLRLGAISEPSPMLGGLGVRWTTAAARVAEIQQGQGRPAAVAPVLSPRERAFAAHDLAQEFLAKHGPDNAPQGFAARLAKEAAHHQAEAVTRGSLADRIYFLLEHGVTVAEIRQLAKLDKTPQNQAPAQMPGRGR